MSDQFDKTNKSDWTLSISLESLTVVNSFVSSAKILTRFCTTSGKSLMNIRNRVHRGEF